MGRILSDTEIRDLLQERKPLPANWATRLKTIPKAEQQYKQRQLEVNGDNGHDFKIVLRQSALNPMDFSCILVFIDKDGTEYPLIRFNGDHPSGHTNRVEKSAGEKNHTFKDTCHIHEATERYQRAGKKIDHFAKPTKLYNSFDSALAEFVKTNGFDVPSAPNGTLFTLPKSDQ